MFSFATPQPLNFVKDVHIGTLYGLSKTYQNLYMKAKKLINLEPMQFLVGYTIILTAGDYALSNSIYKNKYALRSTLPISLIRVLTSWMAFNMDQIESLH